MKRRHSGFTLLEMMVGLSIGLLVLAAVYTLTTSASILASKTFALNSTGTDARNTMDRLQALLRQAYTMPVPINPAGVELPNSLTITGTAATSQGLVPVVTGSTAIVTGTGAGIKFYRYIGGPYLTKITDSAGLSYKATSVNIERDTTAQVVPPKPEAGDILLINTTALTNGSGYQVWATVGGSPVLVSTNGTKETYSVPLTPPLMDKDGNTVNGINYQTDNTGKNPVSWSTSVLRPTAFLIAPRGPNTELGLIDPVVMHGNSIDIDTNYTTLTRGINADGGRAPKFSILSFGGQTFVSIVLQTHDLEHGNFLSKKQKDEYSTALGLNILVDLKSKQ